MDKTRGTFQTSRRKFLSLSAGIAAGAASAVRTRTAFAQAPSVQPVVNLSGEKVFQISMVVRDVQKVARRFSDIFGPSWKFYDLRPKQIVLHNKELGDADCYLKLAIGNIGGRCFKLVQPVSGQSSYSEFLQKQGEGLYSFGIGTLANHDGAVAALKKSGVGIEMQGDLGNNSKFTILETVEDLGCRVEFASPPPNDASETNLKQTGAFVPAKPSVIDMERPIISGGKRFNQIGIVLKDEKKAAQRYEELFGLRGWRFYPIADQIVAWLNEKPVPKADLKSLANDCAMATWGDMGIELLRPRGPSPGGCHQQFLDKHGNGFQHMNMGPRAGDYRAIIDGLKKAGITREFSDRRGDGTSEVSYVAMEDQLGGFVLEISGRAD
jgi:methylmalonyl-CoA/ethylmalonyl-CoA epimerase